MKGKAKETQQFPNISRFITEEKTVLIALLGLALFLFSIFMFLDLKQKIAITQAMTIEKEQIVKDIQKWEKIVSRYANYRDGYLSLAILEYRIGNIDKARVYLKKTLELDPNSKQGREFEQILNKNY